MVQCKSQMGFKRFRLLTQAKSTDNFSVRWDRTFPHRVDTLPLRCSELQNLTETWTDRR